MSEDSYRGDLNDPRTLNYYTYGANNPLLFIDPTGHTFEQFLGNLLFKIMDKNRFLGLFDKKDVVKENIAKRDEMAKGTNGDSTVATAQASLAMAGYDLGNAGVDGKQGVKTTQAIAEFQKSAGLKPTGKLTPETIVALNMVTAAGLNKDQIVELGKATGNVTTLVKVDVNYIESPAKGGGPLLDSRIVDDFYAAISELGMRYHGLLGVVADISPHELGRGFDVAGITSANYTSERSQAIIKAFERHGFKWYGPKDAVHFTAVGTDYSERDYFQNIWKKEWKSTYGAYNCTAH